MIARRQGFLPPTRHLVAGPAAGAGNSLCAVPVRVIRAAIEASSFLKISSPTRFASASFGSM